MLRHFLFAVLAAATLLSPAQEKLKELTLKDAITKSYSDYAPDHLDALQWIPGTEQYSFAKDNTLMRGGTGKMADLPIVTVDQLNPQLPKDAGLKGFPDITWESTDQFSFEQNDKVYVYTVGKSTLSERMALDGKAERSDIDGTKHQVAYTLGEDLYMRGPSTREPLRVTSDGTDGIVSGRSVHREEYGITKGTFWSPVGDKLAFYRMDESMVTPYSLEDISTQPSTFKKIRYPMAGQTSHQVKLGVFDVASNRTTFMKTSGAPDDYLTNISWDPTGKYVFIIHLNRATDKLRVVQYDASTGEAMKTVLEEEDKKWLEPQHPLTFLKRAPTQFIHWSQQDGYWHLYLYDVGKGLVRQLTTGAWVVKNIIGLDEKESAVFVEGTDAIDAKDPKGAMETHIYRVDIASGKTMKLTRDAGTHSGQLGGGGRYLIDKWSSLSVPGRTDMIDAAKGTVLKTLVSSKDPLAQVNVGTVELVKVPGENGDVLNARLIKPKNFDSRQKYPVLVYVYNGPHVQLVTNSFLGGASLWMLHAAQRGYIVFTVDGHGSENRGKAFEQAIYRQLGVTEVKDQLHGADYLKSLPYVDAARMAVHGWSFGGHVTTALMLRSPGTFKVGVAGGPVMDWGMYEVMYTERYMDTPAENPEGYALTRNTDKADQLRNKLLVIIGGMDDTVLPEHSYTFLKNCVEKGVQVDFFEYPGHGHNVRGKDRVHLYTKVLDYIDAGLGLAK
jgi:dipeptidyl-peptidase-4